MSVSFDKESWTVKDTRINRYKYTDTSIAYYKGLTHSIRRIYDSFIYFNNKPYYDNFPILSPLFSSPGIDIKPEGLVIYLHGLRRSYWDWRNVYKIMKDDDRFIKYKFWTLNIEKKGDCNYMDAATDITTVINDYIRLYPDLTIFLIGTSNGSRIAATVESMLDPELYKNAKIRLVSIAGFFGPAHITQVAHSYGILNYMGYHPDIIDALTTDDPHNSLLEMWNEQQHNWKAYTVDVKHQFYASTDDERLYPPTSSLPKLNKYYNNGNDIDNYIIIPGWDHCSIVDGISDIYIEWCANNR